MVHQFCAVALHVSKGEVDVLGLNVALIALAGVHLLGTPEQSRYCAAGLNLCALCQSYSIVNIDTQIANGVLDVRMP